MSIRWPRVLTPIQLSQIIQTQKNPLKALQIFNGVKKKYPNYHHNGPVYATMINILASSNRVMEMKGVIDQMRYDCCECKDHVFVSAIKAYARVGMLNEAVSLFKSISKFNCVSWTESFNTLMKIMLKEGEFDNVRRVLLESLGCWEVKSRVCAMNLLMEALCEHKRADIALGVFQEMGLQGCYPDRESYRIVMRGLCDGGMLNEAIHLLYSMFWRISQKGSGEDVVVYRMVLDALCDNGDVEKAMEILGKILRKGLKAPKRSRHVVDLSLADNGNDIEATKRLINDALVRGGIPSLKSYTAMSVDLYSEGKIDQANKVLDVTRERGYRPSLKTYEAKLAALCREGKVDEAVNVIEVEMRKGNSVPTIKLYNIMLKGLCDTGKSLVAFEYLNKMKRLVGCVANKETYIILVEGLCSESRFHEASQVLEKMLIRSFWPSMETYNMLIPGLCFIGRRYEAVMWLEEMISQGRLPDVCVWNSLVASVCCNVSNVDMLKQFSKC